MFDNQRDCQAFVGSSVLLRKPVRTRFALSASTGILSALAPLLSELRQASERQELTHTSTCLIVTCPEPEVDLDFEVPFICGVGTGFLGALALAVILRCLCSSRVEPITLRLRRLRVDHIEDVRTERSNVVQSRISDRRVVSR